MKICPQREELLRIINKMDIPSYRKRVDKNYDLIWLEKNLKVKNINHPAYQRAMELLEKIK